MDEHWASLLQWLFGNPEKVALGLVLVTGAWRWIREIFRSTTEDKQHDTLTEILIKENKSLWAENKSLRDELRLERMKRNGGASP